MTTTPYQEAVMASAVRRFNTVMLLGWAVFFFNPGAYEDNPFHGAALSPLAPSWVFASVASLIAVMSVVARWWPRISAASLIASTGWWAFMGVATVIENPKVLVWFLYLGVAWLLASEWVVLYLVRERE